MTHRPLRLLLVIAGLHGGGAERVAATLATQWHGQGHDVAVLTTVARRAHSPPDYELPTGVRREGLDIRLDAPSRLHRRLALVRLVLRLRTALKRHRGRQVVAFGDVTNVLTLLAGTGLDIHTTVCERTDPAAFTGLPRPMRLLRRWLYPRADHVIAQTGQAARWLEAQGVRQGAVLPNPLRELPPAAGPQEREALLLTVGRLDRLKGVDVVLRAFAQAAQQHAGWRLAVLGEGPERGGLEALSRSLGVQDRVQFCGHRADIEAWYRRAAILAHGSRLEGFPNVLLEAMASGLAVVATDCPSGPRELIDDGHDGLLVPMDDVAAMADALARVMGDAALRERLAHSAQDVRRRYDASAVARQWTALLAG